MRTAALGRTPEAGTLVGARAWEVPVHCGVEATLVNTSNFISP